MDQIIRIGMDTSKHVFQPHGVNAAEQAVLRKKLRRKEMEEFCEKLPPRVVTIEACGRSHHWARKLQSVGYEVKMLSPQYVKPYVKRGKNDAADAEASGDHSLLQAHAACKTTQRNFAAKAHREMVQFSCG